MSEKGEQKSGFVKNRARPFMKMVKPIGSYGENRGFIVRVFSTIYQAALIIAGKRHLESPFKCYDDAAKAWGIDEDNRELVIRGHFVEFVLFMLIGLGGLLSIYFGLFGEDKTAMLAALQVVGGIMMIFITVFRGMILMWRLDVLRNRHWVNFSQWLRNSD